jgi:hypothetical protein
MINAIATAEIPQETSQNVRRVSDPPEQSAFADAEPDALHPMRGIMTGVLLGAFVWVLLIGLFVAL